MFFLGIDPGYQRLGYGIIRFEKKDVFPQFEKCGVIETSSNLEDGERLSIIYNQLTELYKEYKILGCCVESFFFRKDLTTGVKLIQARGVILLTLAQSNILVHSVYT